MSKWEELKGYICSDMERCEKLSKEAEQKKKIHDKEKWRCCALTGKYIIEFMEKLENVQDK